MPVLLQLGGFRVVCKHLAQIYSVVLLLTGRMLSTSQFISSYSTAVTASINLGKTKLCCGAGVLLFWYRPDGVSPEHSDRAEPHAQQNSVGARLVVNIAPCSAAEQLHCGRLLVSARLGLGYLWQCRCEDVSRRWGRLWVLRYHSSAAVPLFL